MGKKSQKVGEILQKGTNFPKKEEDTSKVHRNKYLKKFVKKLTKLSTD